MLRGRFSFALILSTLIALIDPSAHAATCTAGEAGKTRYNSSLGSVEHCNGTTWLSMMNYSMTPCTTGGAGRVRYDQSAADMQQCDGAYWYSLKASTATTCTATDAGKMRWNSGTSTVQFCDGTNWYNTGNVPSTTGYFVLSNDYFPTVGDNGRGLGNFNDYCYRFLTRRNWKGKANAGLITRARAKAWLCDASSCNNLKPSRTYTFATTGRTDYGGATFTTNASGAGPGNADNWAALDHFGEEFAYWTGRTTGTASAWGTTPGTSTCSGWTTDSSGSTGVVGHADVTTTARWTDISATCDNYYHYICYLDPAEELPNPLAFVDQTGLAVSTLVTSNIVQITGLSGSVSVSVAGSGTPAYRVCADATCSAAPAFTATAGSISNGQYLQLRATTAANTGVRELITASVGGATANWNITTSGTQTGYFVMVPATSNNHLGGYFYRSDIDCYDNLRTLNWKGKTEAGDLSRERVHAWLCYYGFTCYNLLPNTKYAFAVAGTPASGGATFTTDADGAGPGNTTAWSGSTYFGVSTTLGTGRAAGTSTAWGLTGSGGDCTAWGDSSSGSVYDSGSTGSTGTNRWSGTSGTSCATPAAFVCAVDPLPTVRLSFTDVSGAALNAQVTSNIVPMTGLSTAQKVLTNSIGYIQFRTCNDATCTSVATDWTYEPALVGPSQFLQLRMTSAQLSGTTLTAKIYIGTYPEAATWSVTTTGTPTNGYIVLSSNTRNGNFGGLSGGAAVCLSELNANNWRGKSAAGALSSSRVRFWGCDANTCNLQVPNSTYLYAMSGSTAIGGAPSVADQDSRGPFDQVEWSMPAYFGALTYLWTGRTWNGYALAPSTLILQEGIVSEQPAEETCASWSTSGSGTTGSIGYTGYSDFGRWKTGAETCNNTYRYVCMVDPAVLPTAFSFTDQTGVARSTLITSNVVQVTGFTVPTMVNLTPTTGDPQYRICADSGCGTVVQNWTTSTAQITSGQYLQLRVTSSAASLRTHAVNVAAGATSTTWSVTTLDACSHGSTSFSATSGPQTFTIPAGCGNVTFKAWGAGGAGATGTGAWAGGAGAFVTGTVPALPGDVLTLNVGGKGVAGATTRAGGYGGGGQGFTAGGAGGGATYLGWSNNSGEFNSSWTPRYANIVSYFRLNGTGAIANGATVTATIGPNGTASNVDGANMSYFAGNLNNGLSLDGNDDFFAMTGFTALDYQKQFSVSGWSYLNGFNHYAIFFDSTASGIDRQLQFQAGYDTENAKLIFTLTTPIYQGNVITANDVLKLDQWQHILVVYDGAKGNSTDKISLYVDGVKQPMVARGTALPPVTTAFTAPFSYGGMANDWPRWNGMLDELAIWNVALTPAEVALIYARQSQFAHAAGGGGGGITVSTQAGVNMAGGAGGNATSGANAGTGSVYAGRGATATAGGATGTGGAAAGAGTRFNGGAGNSVSEGGGGGGYYGGGAGGKATNINGGGGGGVSWASSILSGLTITAGSGTTAGGNTDGSYPAGVGAGGATGTAGGDGRILISY